MNPAVLVILVFVGLVALTYALILPFGAIYLPTMREQRKRALDLLDLKPGQTLVDLGSGDGTLLIMAAKRGLNAIGYELNPFLVALTWLRSRPYRSHVKIHMKNFWQTDISKSDGVYVFLISHHMKRLDKFMKNQSTKKTIKLVSNSFEIPNKKPIKKSGPMLLYVYDPNRSA